MTPSHCAEAALAEQLLECARRGEPVTSPRLLEHLASCDACRVSVERMRRLVRTWRALEPSAVELAAARVRWVARGRGMGVARSAPRALAVAVVLFAAVASAAVRMVSSAYDRPAAHRVGPPVVATSPGATRIEPGPKPKPEAEAERDSIPVDELPVAPPERPGRKVGASARRSPHDRVLGPMSDGGEPESAWIAAASAMREGDYARAERAFEALTASSDENTRDSARLARAQIWIAQRRSSDAQRELEDLAQTGATPFIRDRATEALGELR
jgi:hypothetical protein